MGVYEIELENLSGYRDYERFMSGEMSLRDLLAIDRLSWEVKNFNREYVLGINRANTDEVLELLRRIDDVVAVFDNVDSVVGHVVEFEVVNDLYVVTYEEVERVVYELNVHDRYSLELHLEVSSD